jgi:hypothetical protein
MNNETLEKLQLFGMYDTFKANQKTSVNESLTIDQFIAYLFSIVLKINYLLLRSFLYL